MNEPTTQDVTSTGIRMHLASRKLSQSWLAEEIGETQHWLSRRMSGKVNFNTHDLDRVAKALNTDFLGLIEITEVPA